MDKIEARLATRAEVAAYFGVPTATLAQWAYHGTGPKYVRVGRHCRYRWSDVDAWLRERECVGEAS